MYLDIDQSLVKEETIHTVIKDAILADVYPKSQAAQEMGGAAMSGRSKDALPFVSVTELYDTPSATSSESIFFSDGSQT